MATGRMAVLGLTTAAVLAATALVAAPSEAGTGVKFGARAGKTVASYQSYESRVNDQVADARLYYLWDQPFPDATATWARDGGRQVFMSVYPQKKNGTRILWKDIADALPGSPIYTQMQTWADAIRNFGAPVYFAFNHEPEAAKSSAMGTPADYRAAWQNFFGILTTNGVTNATYVFIGTAFGYGKGRAQPYYPGDGFVDAIGADAYNWFTCRPAAQNAWFSMQDLVDRMMPFAAEHPFEQLMLPEFGTTEDPNDANRKAQWYSDAEELFKTAPYDRFTLVNEYDTLNACAFRPDSSPASLAAFQAWLNDPYYQG